MRPVRVAGRPRTGRRRTETFDDTSYIYGLEMLAALETMVAEGGDQREGGGLPSASTTVIPTNP